MKRIKNIVFLTITLVICLFLVRVDALDNQVTITDVSQEISEPNAITVSWETDVESDDYYVELYNSTTGKVDRFPSTVSEYTYQDLETNRVYRIAARICLNNECSNWSEVKEVNLNGAVAVEGKTISLTEEQEKKLDDNTPTVEEKDTSITNEKQLTDEEKKAAEEVKQEQKDNFNTEDELSSSETDTEKAEKAQDISASVIEETKQVEPIKEIKLVKIVDGEAIQNGNSLSELTIEENESIVIGTEITPENGTYGIEWKSSNTGVATVTNGVIKGLTEGTATITATATDDSGSAVTSKSLTVKVKKIEAPTLISVTPTGPTTAKLSYEVSKNVEGIEVYVITTGGKVKTTNKTTYTVGGLRPQNTYKIKIKAYYTVNGKAKETLYSSEKTVTTPKVQTPTFTSVVATSFTSTKLTYKPNGKTTYVQVYRNNKLVKSVNNLATYTNTNLKKNTIYSYKIRNCLVVGGKNYYSDFTPAKSVKTSVPAITSAVATSPTSMRITYMIPSGATGVTLYNAKVSPKTKDYNQTKVLTQTNLKPKTNYSFRIKSFKKTNGVKTNQSEYSDIKSASTIVDISKGTVSNVKSQYLYAAKTVAPTPVVTVYGKKLSSKTDYTVTYKNNKQPGVATVTIKGKGNYKGTLKKNYTIYVEDKTTNKGKSKKGDGYDKVITLSGRTYKLYKENKGSYTGHRFANEFPIDATIRSTGCGPTSIAIVLSGFGFKYNPAQTGEKVIAAAKQLKSDTITRGAVFKKTVENEKLSAKVHTEQRDDVTYKKTYKEMQEALKKGRQLVVWVGVDCYGNCHPKNSKYYSKFGSGHHYISVLSINKKGNMVFVGNPQKKKYTGWIKLSTVVKARGEKFWMEVWKPAN